MSVGKGSIQRAAKAKGAAEKKEAAVETPAAEQKEIVAEQKKALEKKEVSAKETVKQKKTPVVAASVISSDDIHEKKFEAASRIYCELPTYLL